jgi:hypothetical protein
MPRFNSQTRRAARISRFVRAIVPTPGSDNSSGTASIVDSRKRLPRRLEPRLLALGRNNSLSGNVLSNGVDEFIFEIAKDRSKSATLRFSRRGDAASPELLAALLQTRVI